MEAITIFKAKDLDEAASRQKDFSNSAHLKNHQISSWREFEPLLGDQIEYFNGDDGNIWMIADCLFIHKVSEEQPLRETVRMVGILRQNEDSKELIFDSQNVFDNKPENREYALKKNLLLN